MIARDNTDRPRRARVVLRSVQIAASKVRALKVRATEIGFLKVRILKVRTLKSRPEEDRIFEVGALKNRPLEASLAEIGVLQVSATRPRPPQIDRYEPETVRPIGGLELTPGQDVHRSLDVRGPLP